ncbi:MAG: imidazole glycerol phosphate synthase subunit HisH [Myxococcota bacterium]|nr:imidazole glycerol phosphate synthase subunit HisH [Myxococcota bacterium]
MPREVVIVDVGMGNLRSVSRALERAGASARITDDPDVIAKAPRLVVPGQGQFRDCASALSGGSGLGDAVRAFVASGRPYLGICLGMQALFASSEEAPGCAGLALLGGQVRRFAEEMRDAASLERLKVPHMGWSEIQLPRAHPLLSGDDRWFYFVHSYVCVPDDSAVIAATADHGGDFCAAVARDNVFACQFHPEKSGAAGHALLERYVEGAWS